MPHGSVIGNFWDDMTATGSNFASAGTDGAWYASSNSIAKPFQISNEMLYASTFGSWAVGTLPTSGSGLTATVTSGAINSWGPADNGSTATSTPPDPINFGAPNPYPGNFISTLAVDADTKADGTSYGRTPYAYGWSYTDDIGNAVLTALQTSGVTGIANAAPWKTNPMGYPIAQGGNNTATVDPLFRIANGGTTTQYTAVPLPTYFGETGADNAYNYWSGGEVFQGNGKIYFGGGELSCLSNYPMMIFDPSTGDYNFSGQIQPMSGSANTAQTGTDNIFTSGATCGGSGYVASDMALDANGNAYLVVESSMSVPSWGVNSSNQGLMYDWLVRVVPSTVAGQPWKYELVEPLKAAHPSTTTYPGTGYDGVTPLTPNHMSYAYGMAFFNGSLYAITGEGNGGTEMVRIDPMAGVVYNIPDGSTRTTLSVNGTNLAPVTGTYNTQAYDMASGQTAYDIQGRVYDTATGTAVPNQTVAIYMDVNGIYTYEGTRVTNAEGDYNFLTAGIGQYVVRLMSPTVNAADPTATTAGSGKAWQSSGSTGDLSNNGFVSTQNQATVICNAPNGNVTSAAPSPCYGALDYGTADPPLPAAAGDTATQPSAMPIYATVTMQGPDEVASVNFGISAVADAKDSTLTITQPGTTTPLSNSTPVGTNLQANTHVVQADGTTALPNATVTLALADSNTWFTDSTGSNLGQSTTCTTDASGNCKVLVASNTAGPGPSPAYAYVGDVSATVLAGSAQAPLGGGSNPVMQGSPQTVIFTPGPPVDGPYVCGDKPGTGVYVTNLAGDSLMSSDTPPVAVQSASTTPNNALYVSGLVTDAACNPITGAPVTLTFDVSKANGTVTVAPDLGTGDSYTSYVLTGTTGADGKVTANLTDTKAGTVTITGTYDNTKPTPAGSPVNTAAPMGTGTATWTVGAVDADSSYFIVDPKVTTLVSDSEWVSVSDGAKADALHQYTVTVFAMDSADDPLSGQTVAITPAGSKASTLKISAVQDNGDGSYTATIWSEVAQSDSTLSVTLGSDPTNISMQQPKKNGGTQTVALIPFKTDAPSKDCTAPAGVTNPLMPGLTADPATDVAAGDTSSTGSTLTTTVTDEFCNPISGATVDFASVSSSAHVSSASGTTDATGTVTTKLTDTVAETVNPTATVTKDQNGAVVSPSIVYTTPVAFIAGQPNTCDGLTPATTCTCTDLTTQTPTNLSVNNPAGTSPIPSAMIPGAILATAHITDQNCNVVKDGTTVNFSLTNVGSSIGSSYTGTAAASAASATTTNGDATVTISDPNPEQVDVHASLDAVKDISQSPKTVEFKVGGISSANSTLVCTSKAVDTTSIPVADGTDYYECVITAKDDASPIPNLLSGLDTSKFNLTFANQANDASGVTQPVHGDVTNTGNGTYTFDVTSTKASQDFTVAADFGGTPVGDPQTKAPIPFKAGPIDVNTTCTVNGASYKVGQVYASPNSTSVGGTSTVTVLLADKECNAIQDATVTFTQDMSATFPGTTNPTTTNLDGLAMSSVTDTHAETVTIGGEYDATAAISGAVLADFSDGTHVNDGTGSLTSDTQSLGGSAPAPTGVSMVQFAADQVSAAQSKLIVSPLTQTVGSPVSVEVDVNDAEGNPVGDVAPTVAVNSTNATLSALTQTAPGSGVWTGTLNSTVTGTYQVTATVPTASGNQPVLGGGDSSKASPQTVTFTAGPVCVVLSCTVTPPPGVDPASVTTRVVVDPNGVIANGTAVDVATVYAFDQYGNPVPGAAVATTAVETTLTAVKGSGTTDPAGSATVGQTTLTYASNLAKAQHAGVTIVDPLDPLQITQAVTSAPIELDFVASAIDPANSTFTVTTAAGDANAPQAANTPFTLSVHAVDAQENPVAGATITFSAASGSTLSAPTCKTDDNGNCSVTVNATIAGNYQVGATAPDASGVAKPLGTATGDPAKTSPQTVTWTAGPICIAPTCTVTPPPGVDPATVTTRVVVDPNGVVNDGRTQDVATVFAYDQWGNPVIGAAVASTATGSNAGDLSTQSTINPTGSNGTTTIGYTSAVAGSYSANVTVVDPSNVAAGQQAVPPTPITLLFGSGLVDPDTSYFTVSPASPLTVGQDAANTYTVTAYANDAMSQPVDSAVISFSTAAGPVWGASPATCTTGAAGQCQLTVYSTVAGTYTLTVKSGSTVIAPQMTGGDQVAWQADGFSAANSSWTLVAGGTMTAGVPSVDGGTYTATLTARDAQNNLIKDLDVSTIAFASSNTSATAVAITSPVVSNKDGTYTVTYTSALADTQPDGTTPIAGVAPLTASVTVGGSVKVALDPAAATLVTDPSIHFVPGTPDAGPVVCLDPTKTGTNFTVTTNSQTVGQPVILKARVTDDQCNPIDGLPVTFTTNGHGQITAVASGDGTVGTTPGTLVGTAVTGQTFPTQTAVVGTDPGNAWVVLTDQVAPDTTTVHATIMAGSPLAAADLKGANPATSSPQDITWTVGGPVINPTCVAPNTKGTNISATSPVTLPSTSTVSVLVTDQFCNPLPNVPVNLSVVAGNGTLSSLTATTGDGTNGTTLGVATVTASDTAVNVPEVVTVQATVPSSDKPTTPIKGTNAAGTGADIQFLAVGTPSIQKPSGGTDPIVTATPPISGTGAVPGDTITVKDGNGNPIPGCDPVTTVNADGTWSCQPTSPLIPGNKGTATLTPVQTDPDGNSTTGPSVQVTIDTTPSTITNPKDDSTVATATPAITGTGAVPGSTVNVVDGNGKPVPGCNPAKVNSDGTWTCSPTAPGLPAGPTTLKPVVTDADGNTLDGTPVSFTVSPTTPAITGPADGSTVATNEPAISGTGAVPGSAVVVDGPDGEPIPGCDPAKVNADGTWSCQPTSPLPEGSDTLTPVLTDEDGNVVPGTPVHVTVDTTPPDAPVVDPTDGSEITGKAEPGSTVTVTSDPSTGEPVEGCVNVPVAADGTFSCTPTSKIPAGTTVYVWARDSAGNWSKPTPVTVPVPVVPAQLSVQTGGTPASGLSVGVIASGLLALTGLGVAIAVRRREESAN